MKSNTTIASVVAALSFFSLSALASAPLPLSSSGLSANAVAKLERASVIIHDTVSKSFCTAFPVSQDGYMMTALHCMRRCLAEQGALERASNVYVGLRDLSVSTRSQQTNVLCKEHSIPQLGIVGVSVVATGSAIAEFDEKFWRGFPNLFNELKAQGFDSRSNDYAILKIQPSAPLSCLKIATSAAAGQPLWAVGFPLPTDPKAAPTLSASAGRLYASAQESRFYKATASQDTRSFVELLYSGAGVMYSDAHTAFGQSGGPVVNSDASVIGIASGFTAISSAGVEVHEMVASSTDKIMKSLPSALAQTLLQKSAACQ